MPPPFQAVSLECSPHAAVVRDKPRAITRYDTTMLVLSSSAFQLLYDDDENDNAGLSLDELKGNDEVATLRNSTGADLVHLITKDDIIGRSGNDICGVA